MKFRALLIGVLAAGPWTAGSPANAADALVFAVSAHPAVTRLSSAEIREIYLGRITRWKDGRRIALGIRPPGSPPGRALFSRVVQMSDIDFSQHWLGIIFRGEATASPRVLTSREDVRQFLARAPAGLAPLLASEIAPGEPPLRVLVLDGAEPRERGYPFSLP